jgi:hypothetical protein
MPIATLPGGTDKLLDFGAIRDFLAVQEAVGR